MSAGVRRLSIRLFRFLQITQSSRNLMLRAVQIKPSGAAAVRIRSSKSLICMSFARQSSCVTLPADVSYIHSVNSSGPLTCLFLNSFQLHCACELSLKLTHLTSFLCLPPVHTSARHLGVCCCPGCSTGSSTCL